MIINLRNCSALAIFLWLLLAAACGASREQKLRENMEKALMPANVPVSIQNGVDAPDIKQDASNVLTVSGGNYYWGREQYPVDAIEDKAHRYFTTAPGKPVDVQADYTTDYGNVVKVLDGIRHGGGKDIALLVRPDQRGEIKRFAVSLLPEPTPDMKEDVSIPEIKLAKDGKITIGKKDVGTIETLDKITESLRSTSTRTVNIRATKGSRYADVVKIADAAKSGGASQVNLVIDDLVD